MYSPTSPSGLHGGFDIPYCQSPVVGKLSSYVRTLNIVSHNPPLYSGDLTWL